METPIKSLLIRLMKDSSVHGVKYIAQTKRPLERLFWVLILMACNAAAAYLMYEVIQKYNQSPVIVSFQPSQTSILDVPFPAITVCSANRFRKSYFENIWRDMNKDFNTSSLLLRQLDHICSLGNAFSHQFDYSLDETTVNLCKRDKEGTFGFGCKYHEVNETHHHKDDQGFLASHKFPQELMIYLLQAFPTCEEMIPLCVWEGEVEKCSGMFYRIITDMGFCCTFNMMPRQLLLKKVERVITDPEPTPEQMAAWNKFNIDDVLQINENVHSKAEKILKYQSKAGQSSGLSILLNPDLEEYFCDNHDSYGFRIYAHSPIEFPHISDFGVAVSPSNEMFMSLQADLTTADKEIKELDVGRRQCYYSREQPLDSFTIYTAANCVAECIAVQVAKICKCARVDLPLKFSDPELANVTFCEGENLHCARAITVRMTKQGVQQRCSHCKASCNKIEYMAQMSALPMRPNFKFNNPEWEDEGNVDRPKLGDNMTIVHIFFGSDTVYSRIRKNLYTTSELFAHVGGLLGLFLGLSVLSLLEPINFIFRICLRKQEKPNSPVADDSYSRQRNAQPGINMRTGRTDFGNNYRNKLQDHIGYFGRVPDQHPFPYRGSRY